MVQRSGVLIETYWNVNKDVVDAMQKTRQVLIETYWNVNLDVLTLVYAPRSINRNILECKFCVQRCGCYHF